MFGRLSIKTACIGMLVLMASAMVGVVLVKAKTSKAICRTLKGDVYITKAKIEGKRMAYTKCTKYVNEPWKFLSRRVNCVKRVRRDGKNYRCRCIARLCKLREAKSAKLKVKEPEAKKEPEVKKASEVKKVSEAKKEPEVKTKGAAVQQEKEPVEPTITVVKTKKVE